MRIIAGSQRGRAIVAPKKHSTRPTADRTRQAMFNVLEHAPWSPGIPGARVLDLFAGSGALGLEALSRGADFCGFVDDDAEAVAIVGQNIAALRHEARCETQRADATRPAPALPPFTLIFLDPPYAKGLVEPTLAQILAQGLLDAAGVAVIERGVAEAPLAAPGYDILDSRVWGAARVWFLKRSAAV